MGRRETLSAEDLSAAVEAIYDAAMDDALWPRALKHMTDLLGGNCAVVALEDGARRFPAYHCVGYSPELQEAYNSYYHFRDPMLDIATRSPPLSVLTDRMVMPKAELRRLEVHSDFARANGIDSLAYAFAFRAPDRACFVAATRSARAGDFEREHVRTLGLLLPHLGRAMRVHVRLEDARVRAEGAAEALDRLAFGVVLVDRHARVVLANRAAEAMLARGDGIGADASGLRAATPAQTAALRRLVAQAADRARVAGRGGALRLDRPSLGRPLSVLVTPVGVADAGDAWLPEPRPAAIVFMADPEQRHRPPASHLREIYGLTAAEAAVAGSIAQGQGVKDAAKALGIAPSTLRWHRQRVFEKTGTARQTELARLVERLGAMVAPPGAEPQRRLP
jgi:DNA-binding CsgD family transcriptional regulator